MIGIVFSVYDYINNKRIRLRSEIRENVEAVFEGHQVENCLSQMMMAFRTFLVMLEIKNAGCKS